MAPSPNPRCDYCGGTRYDERGACADCGNERRNPLVTKPDSAHKAWYSLEKSMEAEESQAKPKPKTGELPENMRVPQHKDWYEIAGTSPVAPRRPEAPAGATTRNAVLTFSIAAVVVLMGIAGYLLYAMHQPVPIGVGHP